MHSSTNVYTLRAGLNGMGHKALRRWRVHSVSDIICASVRKCVLTLYFHILHTYSLYLPEYTHTQPFSSWLAVFTCLEAVRWHAHNIYTYVNSDRLTIHANTRTPVPPPKTRLQYEIPDETVRTRSQHEKNHPLLMLGNNRTEHMQHQTLNTTHKKTKFRRTHGSDRATRSGSLAFGIYHNIGLIDQCFDSVSLTQRC